MALDDTKRRIRFNDRFNISDTDPDLGFLGINGEIEFPNSEIKIIISYWDPNSSKSPQTTDEGLKYNEQKGQVFIFT